MGPAKRRRTWPARSRCSRPSVLGDVAPGELECGALAPHALAERHILGLGLVELLGGDRGLLAQLAQPVAADRREPSPGLELAEASARLLQRMLEIRALEQGDRFPGRDAVAHLHREALHRRVEPGGHPGPAQGDDLRRGAVLEGHPHLLERACRHAQRGILAAEGVGG